MATERQSVISEIYTRFPLPDAKPIRTETGCRVSWRVYATERDAIQAAEPARREGQYLRDRGYDFGLCCPGSVEKVRDGWRVCFA